MVRSGTTAFLPLQLRLPYPFSRTVAPLRPIRTEAPGKPPALMARAMTLSTFSRRLADMPTADGALEGKPPPAPPPFAKRTKAVNNDVSNSVRVGSGSWSSASGVNSNSHSQLQLYIDDTGPTPGCSFQTVGLHIMLALVATSKHVERNEWLK